MSHNSQFSLLVGVNVVRRLLLFQVMILAVFTPCTESSLSWGKQGRHTRRGNKAGEYFILELVFYF